LLLFGKRLQAIRLAVDLSQEQVHHATGISQSHIARTELGQLNTSISHVAMYAELFGLKDHEMLDYEAPIPDSTTLKKSVTKFLKSRGFDPEIFLKQHQGATHVLQTKLLETKFLTVPRFAREIADYCKEKYDADFTTSQVSKGLDGLHKKGVLEKLKTDKKTKFQYRKK
jgi:transcriptional regulator with XRE-family HTH domain